MKRILTLGLYIAIFLVGYAFMLGLNEEKYIYFPEKELADDPSQHGWAYEDVYLDSSENLRLHGWYIPAVIPAPDGARGQAPAGIHTTTKTLFYLHGNAGNISDCLAFMAFLRKHINVHIFLFDYRGYGNSQGKPSEQGIYADALAGYYFLIQKKKVSPQDLIIYGKSLGGAVAIDLASKKEAAKLVVENTFSSAVDMAKKIYPFLPVGLFIKTKFHSAQKISKITMPKLIIHANQDETVPYRLGQKLYAHAAPPKTFYTVETSLHGSTYQEGGPAYAQKLKDFLDTP